MFTLGGSIAIIISVCLSVYMYVCLFVSLLYMSQKGMSHEIFCTCYVCPWLGPALTTVQYILYTRFVDDVMFSHHWAYTDN